MIILSQKNYVNVEYERPFFFKKSWNLIDTDSTDEKAT
jgi:hypothetical protein